MPNTENWEENYDLEKPNFLVYDKQSGSRWIDDEKFKDFIRTEIARERKEGMEEMKKTILQSIDNYWAGKYVTPIRLEPLDVNGRKEIPHGKLPTLDQYFIANDLKGIISALDITKQS